MEATKTQVSVGTTRKFAWVWLRRIYTKKRPENSITLTFALGRHMTNDRIADAVEPRPRRWTYHVIIEKEGAWMPMFKEWIREAYAFSKMR